MRINAKDKMATNMAGVMNISAAENTVPVEDPDLVTETQVVNDEQVKQDQLYIDFASDAPPVSIQTGVSAGDNLAKRIDPRQEWINTDKTKPYFCKLCDYSMDCMEVGAFFQLKTELDMGQTLCKLLHLFQHTFT